MKIIMILCLFTAVLNLLAASSLASTPSEVIEAQRCLAVLGFDPGPIDGVIGTRTADAFARYGARRGLAVAIYPEAVARRLFRECHARLSRRPMPPPAVEVGPDDFLVLSYCLKAVGFYHGPVVTRATPELTYAFAAYTTTNGFSVNTRGVARAGACWRNSAGATSRPCSTRSSRSIGARTRAFDSGGSRLSSWLPCGTLCPSNMAATRIATTALIRHLLLSTPILQHFTLVGGYVSRTRTIHQWGKLGFEATDRGTINETLRSCFISFIWQWLGDMPGTTAHISE